MAEKSSCPTNDSVESFRARPSDQVNNPKLCAIDDYSKVFGNKGTDAKVSILDGAMSFDSAFNSPGLGQMVKPGSSSNFKTMDIPASTFTQSAQLAETKHYSNQRTIEYGRDANGNITRKDHTEHYDTPSGGMDITSGFRHTDKPADSNKPAPIEPVKPLPVEGNKPAPIETVKPLPVEGNKPAPEGSTKPGTGDAHTEMSFDSFNTRKRGKNEEGTKNGDILTRQELKDGLEDKTFNNEDVSKDKFLSTAGQLGVDQNSAGKVFDNLVKREHRGQDTQSSDQPKAGHVSASLAAERLTDITFATWNTDGKRGLTRQEFNDATNKGDSPTAPESSENHEKPLSDQQSQMLERLTQEVARLEEYIKQLIEQLKKGGLNPPPIDSNPQPKPIDTPPQPIDNNPQPKPIDTPPQPIDNNPQPEPIDTPPQPIDNNPQPKPIDTPPQPIDNTPQPEPIDTPPQPIDNNPSPFPIDLPPEDNTPYNPGPQPIDYSPNPTPEDPWEGFDFPPGMKPPGRPEDLPEFPEGGIPGIPGLPGSGFNIDKDPAWVNPPAGYGEGNPFPDLGKPAGPGGVPVKGTSDIINQVEQQAKSPQDPRENTTVATEPMPELWVKLSNGTYMSAQQIADSNPFDGKPIYSKDANGNLNIKLDMSVDPYATYQHPQTNVNELYYRGTDGNLHQLKGNINYEQGESKPGHPDGGWYHLDFKAPKDMAFVRQEYTSGNNKSGIEYRAPHILEKVLVNGKIISHREAAEQGLLYGRGWNG